jgi:hypothetical protein
MSRIYTRPQQTGSEFAKRPGQRWIGGSLSRRQLMRSLAGFTGLGIGLPRMSRAAGADPKPIPGGVQPFGPGTEVFHVILPGQGNEPSTITDFNGFIGITHVAGMGTGRDTISNTEIRLIVDADMRFMLGEYIGMDSRLHRGAFAFV